VEKLVISRMQRLDKRTQRERRNAKRIRSHTENIFNLNAFRRSSRVNPTRDRSIDPNRSRSSVTRSPCDRETADRSPVDRRGTSFVATFASRRNDRVFHDREFRECCVSVADSLGTPSFMSEGKFASSPSPKPGNVIDNLYGNHVQRPFYRLSISVCVSAID